MTPAQLIELLRAATDEQITIIRAILRGETPACIEMSWIPWTDKSSDIPFKSSKNGVGDGEEKVARELDTTTLGQNSSYDMKPVLNGVETKCDVKKLDTQNDFNTGKEGRDALRPIKSLHTTLLNSLNEFANSSLFTPTEQAELAWFHDVSPDELAVGTLDKLRKICMMLFTKKQRIRSALPTISFTFNSQTHTTPLDIYYSICQKLGMELPEEMTETLTLLRKMDHPYIDEPDRLMADLNSLVGHLFADITIIIVDSVNGYRILNDISKVQFYRITRGNPRFKIVF